MEHNLFPLEFQLPDGKDALQTAQKCYQLKIQSFCNAYDLFSNRTWLSSSLFNGEKITPGRVIGWTNFSH